jgi:hypothetical protein
MIPHNLERWTGSRDERSAILILIWTCHVQSTGLLGVFIWSVCFYFIIYFLNCFLFKKY